MTASPAERRLGEGPGETPPASGVQLRTLLSCDLVDSTGITERLGDVGAAELFDRHDETARRLLDDHGGLEINKSDGFLLLFDRPTTAVRFALTYQRRLGELGGDAGVSLSARVGVHLGEVLLRRNDPRVRARGARRVDIDGLSVAVAARLQNLAHPGQILLTRAAFDIARRGFTGAQARDLHWQSHGAYHLQGITEPVEVYEVRESGSAPLAPPADSGKARRLSGLPRVLVLPFGELAAQPGHDFVGIGLTDRLITRLSSLAALRIISRSAAMQLGGSSKNISTLGRELNVQYVVEGSFQRAGDRLEICVEFARVADEELLWARRFRGRLTELFEIYFEIEETVAVAVAGALNMKLDPEAPPVERPIPNVRAYEYYLRAKQQIFMFTEEALDRALEYLQKGAALLGEDNAQLVSAMGYVYWQYYNAGIRPDPAYLEKARECGAKLLTMDADSPEAHRLLGLVDVHTGGGLQAAVQHLETALAGNPNDTDALFWLVLLYGFVGRPSSGHPLAERLLEIDPLTPLHHILPGFLAVMEGAPERACPLLLDAHRTDPGNPITTLFYGQTLAMNGQPEEARSAFMLLERDHPDSFFAALGSLYKAALAGDREGALAGLTGEVPEACRFDPQYSWSLAQCLAMVGEQDEAVGWLANAAERGFVNHPLFESDPLLAGIRENAGFRDLLADIHRQWTAFGQRLADAPP